MFMLSNILLGGIEYSENLLEKVTKAVTHNCTEAANIEIRGTQHLRLKSKKR